MNEHYNLNVQRECQRIRLLAWHLTMWFQCTKVGKLSSLRGCHFKFGELPSSRSFRVGRSQVKEDCWSVDGGRSPSASVLLGLFPVLPVTVLPGVVAAEGAMWRKTGQRGGCTQGAEAVELRGVTAFLRSTSA